MRIFKDNKKIGIERKLKLMNNLFGQGYNHPTMTFVTTQSTIHYTVPID